MPQVYFGAVKAPCLMAGAAVVTAVIGDFTACLHLSFLLQRRLHHPQPRPLQPLRWSVERRWGSKLWLGNRLAERARKPRLICRRPWVGS